MRRDTATGDTGHRGSARWTTCAGPEGNEFDLIAGGEWNWAVQYAPGSGERVHERIARLSGSAGMDLSVDGGMAQV